MDYKFYVGFAVIGLVVGSVTAVEPVFKDTTSNVTAVQGDDVILPCTVLNTSANIKVNWTNPDGEQLTHGENVLLNGERYSVERQSTWKWDLKIKSVDFPDSGTYVCEIKSGTPQRKSVHFTVKAPTVINLVGSGNKTTQPSTAQSSTTQSSTAQSTLTPFSTTQPSTVQSTLTPFSTTQSSKTQSSTAQSILTPFSTTQSSTILPSTTQSPTTEDPRTCSGIRPCRNSGICVNGTCNCTNDFIGSFCEEPTVCPPNFCNINNTNNCSVELENGSFVYKCKCLPFYKGDQCEIYDFCELNPCNKTNEQCVSLYKQNSYECHCIRGDPNNDCKLNDEDNCRARPPSNPNAYITCIDQIDSFKMYCSPGYSGEKTGCSNNENLELYCNRSGPGYCIDEGYCKPLCNADVCNGTENCKFTADPYNTTGFHTKSECVQTFGDGYDHPNCHEEDTLFDGFDKKINELKDCSPYFDTVCTRNFSDGDCNPECNNADCLFDGFDCSNDTELAGVVVVEIKGQLEAPPNVLQNNMSMMLRSGVNLTVETFRDEPTTFLSLKITKMEFTVIEYAGKFLAAVVAKRPGWLDGVKITDIFVCPAGSYSSTYSDKCRRKCSTCNQVYDICDWKTGRCLHGCFNNSFYGAMCKQCPQNCVGGCNENGHCNTCPSDRHGTTCEKLCDEKCQSGTCNRNTGICECKDEYYWSDHDKRCVNCSDGCKKDCDASSGSCICRDGYYGSMCTSHCMDMCLNGTCHVNGTCDKGCDPGYYGPTCANACPSGCNTCSRDGELCEGNCKPGYEGSTCKKSSGQSGYIDDVTDNTGLIIGVIISLLLVVLILTVAYCYWKKRKSGDYVMGDEEMEEPPPKESNTIDEHTNMHMQPTSSLLEHSSDMIELDEKQNIAVYAGPGRGQTAEDGDKMPTDKGPGEKEQEADKGQPTDDNSGDAADNKAEDTDKKNEKCTSSVVIEIGTGGRVLSVSDGDEAQSPTLKKEVELPIGEEEESIEDDSAFANPPQSPLGEVRAPLASEENILASLGPKEIEHDTTDEPVGLDEELAKAEDKESKRSSSSSSSSSNSSKSGKEDNHEIATEM